MNTESFEKRHIGPTKVEIDQMLKIINAKSIDDLIDQTIPKSIRNNKPNVAKISDINMLSPLRILAAC